MQALLLVDIQNDFMPFGSLPVPDGDAVVAVANRIAPTFDLVVATQDWHPADHTSFASNHPGHRPGDMVMVHGIGQVLWPDHCVQNTPGASLHSALDIGPIDHVIHKGIEREIDSYSTFFDNLHQRDTGLDAYLRERHVTDVVLMGLATDYCVLFSGFDALELGYRVTVLSDGVRAVDIQPDDGAHALAELAQRGARVCASTELDAGA